MSVSLPRDTYVPLGCEDGSLDKLTHAGLYGISCTVKTVENLVDRPINYFVRINFTGLVDIIDILGGVDVYSDNEFTTDSGMHIKKGMNTLDGTQALEFARERYNIESGDLARVANHQALLKGIITRISSSEHMMKIPQLSRYFKDMVDTNLTEDDISKLLSQHLSQNNSWTIHEAILGGTGDMQEVYSLPSITSIMFTGQMPKVCKKFDVKLMI
ncbi:LCP family protein [Erysipelothrix sp. D19-032]